MEQYIYDLRFSFNIIHRYKFYRSYQMIKCDKIKSIKRSFTEKNFFKQISAAKLV